jgi:hypothetical protein
MEFGLGLEEFRFKIELDELIQISQILKDKLDNKSKIALRDLLEEIEKIYSKIVGTISPFYGLNKDMIFEKEFGEKYENFKKSYLEDLNKVGYSCNITKDKLDQLIKNHGWNPNPFRQLLNRLQRNNKGGNNEQHLRELENLINRWYADDRLVYIQIRDLQNNLNNGLDKVNELFIIGNIRESLQQLHSFLKDSEKLFFELTQSFQQLKQISNELH